MILLSATHIRRAFGPEPVLDGVSFELRRGERIGLVGPNGAGKTTLMRILAGVDEADGGHIHIPASVRVGYLAQHADFEEGETPRTVAEAALTPLMELAQAAEDAAHALAIATSDPTATDARRHELAEAYEHAQRQAQEHHAYHIGGRIEGVFKGLGITDDQCDQPLATMSGGQQNRVALAALLLAEPDVMLLDEPSNHLDLAATEWLEGYLADPRKTFIVVSHDRFLLDRVTDHTLELFHGTVDRYKGAFSAYWRQKAERVEVQTRTYEKQQEEIEKLKDFIRRNHYGMKATQAEDRRKKLQRIERVAPPRVIEGPPMGFPDGRRSGDVALRAEGMAKSYGKTLFQDLSFDVLRGQRWGVLGPNGCGKTTLVQCLLHHIESDAGRAIHGANVDFGYFDQRMDAIDGQTQAVEAVRPPHREFNEPQRRSLLGRFGVTGDMAFQPFESLSGGERNRVALARIAALHANFLILDEPTNHLDLWSRDSLERSLKTFPGSAMIISHDRYFLNRVVDHMLVFTEMGVKVIDGNYDTFHMLADCWKGGEKPAGTARIAAQSTNRLTAGAASTPDAPVPLPVGGEPSDPIAIGRTPFNRFAVSGEPSDRLAVGGGPSDRLAVGGTPTESATNRRAPASSKKQSTKEAKRKRRFPYRKVADIEADITRHESLIEALEGRLADPAVLRNGAAVKATTVELEQAQEELEELLEHWEEASELNW